MNVLFLKIAFPFLLAAGAAPLRAGDPAPPLDGIALDGRPARMELTGRVTLVDFFATWCPRCRESVGGYGELGREFGDRLQIVVVDVEEPAALVSRFFSAFPLPPSSVVLLDPTGQTMDQFGPRSFPSFYLVDERGIVRAVSRGWGPGSAAQLARRVRGLLAESSRTAARASRSNRRRTSTTRRPDHVSEDERARRLGVEILR